MESSIKNRLLELSQTRIGSVKIEGEKFVIKEVGAAEFAEYGTLITSDKLKATAFLLSSCLVDENGSPFLTRADAEVIARSARISMPIISKIMELSGFGEADQKKPDAG